MTPQDEVLLSHGFSILWVTFTSRSTPYNYSHGNTPMVIAVAVISAFVLLRIVPRCRYTAFGMG